MTWTLQSLQHRFRDDASAIILCGWESSEGAWRAATEYIQTKMLFTLMQPSSS